MNCVGQDDYSVQERFFRQYYNAFREELNTPYPKTDKRYYLGYLATRTTLLDIYEKMIKDDYKRFLDDLSEKAEYYSVIVNNSDEVHEYTDALQELSRISGAPSYILLLYLMSNQDEFKHPSANETKAAWIDKITGNGTICTIHVKGYLPGYTPTPKSVS